MMIVQEAGPNTSARNFVLSFSRVAIASSVEFCHRWKPDQNFSAFIINLYPQLKKTSFEVNSDFSVDNVMIMI